MIIVSGVNNMMLDDDKLDGAIRDLIIDICEVLYKKGYENVPVGAMMRLVGVSNDHASKHDDTFFALDKDFVTLLEEKRKKPIIKNPPSGVTIH